ncbi:TIGR03084 family metal-binding protein [Nocardia jinanensis]|uniref:TIGR03084 family protein n=1 Tax=Nocardia jinanensis TaxID=382504 RepID=A0A917RTG5_9NOCA|nr:TIGR03084 family metal-binding protein [Nocardia jinanensis]GGL26573.1 TIGR03084 family protein [Nocardia jinanensis]
MADLDALLRDLAAEGADLESLVAELPQPDWARPTPAAGWTIAHQIGHLAWTDEVAGLAATDARTGGTAFADLLTEAAARVTTFVDEAAEAAATTPPPELLERWRRGRAELAAALRAAPGDAKVPWFGPPMRPGSMATARLMETWAHGQDVADALGVHRTATGRLRSVAHIGVRTRNFAYAVRELPAPGEEFRIELRAPSGELWSWGPEEALERVTGPALDFCLLVTQRRHPDDLALRTTGPEAARWLTIAQAFAGPPGSGRAPGRPG